MSKSNWQPSAGLTALQERAELLAAIRQFFARRQVLEVETPLLSQHTVTDVYIDSFAVPISETTHYFLQTSPEYAMKRLLAEHQQSIYQISKVFRREEQGACHNSEFTLLEWYRVGFDHQQLMDEVSALLVETIQAPPARRMTYRELFLEYLDIDPFLLSLEHIERVLIENHIHVHTSEPLSKDTALDLLLTHGIEPKLPKDTPLFIYHYPASQAALAKTCEVDGVMVAERFELYYQGVELANGFHELIDPVEQLARFQQDQAARRAAGLSVPDIDQRLLDALPNVPPTAGVALGIDRLVMVWLGLDNLTAVINFPWNRA